MPHLLMVLGWAITAGFALFAIGRCTMSLF